MNALAARSVARSLAGLAGVGLALAALVIFLPGKEAEPATPWAPAGYRVVETVALDGDRTLRLWVSPSGWWVESLSGGEHEAAVGAAGPGYQHTASVHLDGLLGTMPTAGAQTVVIRPVGGGTSVRATVHDRLFLVPAWIVTPGGRAVLMTPYDAAGHPLGGEVTVPIAGR